MSSTRPPLAKPLLYCSFCGKNQHEVGNLIAGPRAVFICDECIVLCIDVINECRAKHAAELRAGLEAPSTMEGAP